MILLAATLTAYVFCHPGYARSVRPPFAITEQIKRRLLHGKPTRGYVLDHRIPLELAGSPLDPNNLQIQTYHDAHLKDLDENRLHRAVCAGRMTLSAARREMMQWRPDHR